MAVVSEAERTQAATARLAALEDDDFAAVADAGADNSDDEFVVDLGGSDDGARPPAHGSLLPTLSKSSPILCSSNGVLPPAIPVRRTRRRRRTGAQAVASLSGHSRRAWGVPQGSTCAAC